MVVLLMLLGGGGEVGRGRGLRFSRSVTYKLRDMYFSKFSNQIFQLHWTFLQKAAYRHLSVSTSALALLGEESQHHTIYNAAVQLSVYTSKAWIVIIFRFAVTWVHTLWLALRSRRIDLPVSLSAAVACTRSTDLPSVESPLSPALDCTLLKHPNILL